MILRFFVGILLVHCCSTAWAQEFDHSGWDKLLRAHVVVLDDGSSTQVDYDGFAANADVLQQYLNTIAEVDEKNFISWDASEQLAFLINTYNSATVAFILTKYPELDSIKDLGSFFSSPWKKEFISLFGDTVSLDFIEHELIRGSGRYNEPRIHFAVNCASVGCPALRSEAYTGVGLEVQLDSATRSFLKNKSQNRYEDEELKISSIFKWYKEDFEKGWKGYESLHGFLFTYAGELGVSSGGSEELVINKLPIQYLSYDWDLNKKQ